MSIFDTPDNCSSNLECPIALRTLDALRLSVALGLKRAGLATVFVAADQKPCRVATLEGFVVTNPEQPALVT
jgi:hypothetical protein